MPGAEFLAEPGPGLELLRLSGQITGMEHEWGWGCQGADEAAQGRA